VSSNDPAPGDPVPSDPASRAGRAAARIAGALRPSELKRKATEVGATMKAEFEAGARGDDGPVTPLWASPIDRVEAFVAKLRRARSAPTTDDEVLDDEVLDREAEEVAEAVRTVDWSAVRTATSAKSADAARVMRSMADQVDWAKVQPVAGSLTSALIAAVAAGQIPVGGQLGSTVARAIVDQGGLGQKVGGKLAPDEAPDYRPVLIREGIIDVPSTELR